MKRSRTGLAAAPAPDKLLGVPVPLLLAGVAAALALAYANSGGSDAPLTQAAGAALPGAGSAGSSPASPSGSSKPSSSAATKPKRAAVLKAASPLLYVFVDSIGGEGIFARLRNTAIPFDGNGLDRITTLANHEFAGWWTGKTWKAPDTLNEYIQLYQVVGNVGYNYWIQKKETVQLHAQAAAAGYNWTDFTHPSDGTLSAIASFFFDHYTL